MKKYLIVFAVFILRAGFAQECSEIFISEYIEGTGNNRAIELYNPTPSAIDLSGYTLERHQNGASNANSGGSLALSGTVGPYETFVIANGQTTVVNGSPPCSPVLQAMAQQLDHSYPAPTYMSGNDAIVLKKNGVMIDIMGKSGDASIGLSVGWSDVFPYDGSEGTVWTGEHSLQRKSSVRTGVSINPDVFIVTMEWDSLPVNDWSNVGTHSCTCSPIPIPTASYSVSQNEICAGKEITFTSTSTGNPDSFSWSFPGGVPSSSTDENPSVVYPNSGTYDVTLTVSNSNGVDTQTDNDLLEVFFKPDLTLGTTIDPSDCAGIDGSIQLLSTDVDGYVFWYGTSSGTQMNVFPMTISGLSHGTYFIYSYAPDCNSDTLNVTFDAMFATPTISSSSLDNIICPGFNITLTSSYTTGNLWSNGETTQSVTIATAGNYSVTHTENNCSLTSSPLMITESGCNGTIESVKDDIQIYPNPSNSSIMVSNVGLKSFHSLELFSLNGKSLGVWNLDQLNQEIDLSQLDKGFYTIKIYGQDTIVKTIVKQ